MENQQEHGNKIMEKMSNTFPRRSSPVGRGTTKGGAILPEANTSVCTPVMLFIIIYSLLIPIHMLSPHQAIDFTTSGIPNSFTSTNSRPPDKQK
jgi:hypothetical protein